MARSAAFNIAPASPKPAANAQMPNDRPTVIVLPSCSNTSFAVRPRRSPAIFFKARLVTGVAQQREAGVAVSSGKILAVDVRCDERTDLVEQCIEGNQGRRVRESGPAPSIST